MKCIKTCQARSDGHIRMFKAGEDYDLKKAPKGREAYFEAPKAPVVTEKKVTKKKVAKKK